MHSTISYRGDNTGRRSINDMVRWFGLAKSKTIIVMMQNAKAYKAQHPEWDCNKFLNGVCMAIEMGGVSGEPVRRLFAHYLGEEVLQDWINS
jgi:hypothetical protein